MELSKKQIYWGIGITGGLFAIGLLAHHARKNSDTSSSDIANNVQHWLRPVLTKISSPFGFRTNPITKKTQYHNGIDLPTPLNTKVKSPMDGIIENVYNNAAGGNQLIIKHNNGYTTGYAHLTKAMVKKGDKVKQGEIIALSGSTGKSTGPHVHFTLKDKKGNWLDPAKVVYANAA